MNYKLFTSYKKLLADTTTSVSIYLKIRDKFPNSILLESSDYHGNENSFSFICCKPIAGIKLENGILKTKFPDGKEESKDVKGNHSVMDLIQQFAGRFEPQTNEFKFNLFRHFYFL